MTTRRECELIDGVRQIAEALGVKPEAPVAAVVAAARAVGALQADRDRMLVGLEGLGWPCRLVELPEYTAKLTKQLGATRDELAKVELSVANATPAKQRYEELVAREEELSAIERLRFFCSLAMRGQDWLDVEPLFDDVLAELRTVEQLPERNM